MVRRSVPVVERTTWRPSQSNPEWPSAPRRHPPLVPCLPYIPQPSSFASLFVESRRIASRYAVAAPAVSAFISSTFPRNTYIPDEFG